MYCFFFADGYVSNTCVDVDYEEIKRKIRSKAAPPLLPPPVHDDEDVYDDVGADPLNRYTEQALKR